MVRIKTSKGWKTIKPGQTIRGVTNVTKRKSSRSSSGGSSGSSRQTTTRTTTQPKVVKVAKPSLIKKAQLDLLFILKNYFGRLFNKRMTVNVETVPRTVITRGRVGPIVPFIGPLENEIIIPGEPLPFVGGGGGGGGGGGRKPVTPIQPVTPVTPVTPIGITPTKTGYYSSKKTYAATGANRLTLYADYTNNKRMGSQLTRKIDGYYIIVKKGKKKVRLRTPLLTLNDAIDLLAYKLDNNLIRVGEIVRFGKTKTIGRIPERIKGYFIKNKRKFAIIPLKNGFSKMLIERKAYAKDKPGERKRKVKKRVVKKKVIKRKKPIKRKRKK